VVRSVVTATRAAAVLFALTAVITVSVDLIYAVGIGIAAAAVISLRSLARAAGVHREELPGPAEPGDEHIALFRIEGSLFFAAAERVLERVAAIQDVDVVILRLSQVQVLDASGAQVLQELVTGLERRGVTVLVKGIRQEHLAVARRVGVVAALRDEAHLVDGLAAAVARARAIAREAGARTPA
jgi:SulP family sulfate permease